MDAEAGHMRLTLMEGNDSPGSENQEDGLEKKNRILSLYEAKANQNRGADSFLHPNPVGALIQFCVVR